MSELSSQVTQLFDSFALWSQQGPISAVEILTVFPAAMSDVFFQVERKLVTNEKATTGELQTHGYKVEIHPQHIPDTRRLYTRAIHVKDSFGQTLIFQDSTPVHLEEEQLTP